MHRLQDLFRNLQGMCVVCCVFVVCCVGREWLGADGSRAVYRIDLHHIDMDPSRIACVSRRRPGAGAGRPRRGHVREGACVRVPKYTDRITPPCRSLSLLTISAPGQSQVHISSLALLKMLKHGRAGVPMEVSEPGCFWWHLATSSSLTLTFPPSTTRHTHLGDGPDAGQLRGRLHGQLHRRVRHAAVGHERDGRGGGPGLPAQDARDAQADGPVRIVQRLWSCSIESNAHYLQYTRNKPGRRWSWGGTTATPASAAGSRASTSTRSRSVGLRWKADAGHRIDRLTHHS